MWKSEHSICDSAVDTMSGKTHEHLGRSARTNPELGNTHLISNLANREDSDDHLQIPSFIFLDGLKIPVLSHAFSHLQYCLSVWYGSPVVSVWTDSKRSPGCGSARHRCPPIRYHVSPPLTRSAGSICMTQSHVGAQWA